MPQTLLVLFTRDRSPLHDFRSPLECLNFSAARHTARRSVPSLAKLCAGRPQPAKINHGDNAAS